MYFHSSRANPELDVACEGCLGFTEDGNEEQSQDNWAKADRSAQSSCEVCNYGQLPDVDGVNVLAVFASGLFRILNLNLKDLAEWLFSKFYVHV